MHNAFSISRNGQQFGPYDREQTLQYLRSGTLALTDLAWVPGLDKWTKLLELIGLDTVVGVYIARGGQQFGPYNGQSLAEFLRTGAVRLDDQAWCEGVTGWCTLEQVLIQIVK